MNCENHPDKEATGSCVNCGNFFCDECVLEVDNKRYCKSCASEILSEEGSSDQDVTVTQQTSMQTSSGSSGSATENEGSGTDTEFLFKLGNYVGVLFFGGLTVTAVAETPEVLVLPLLASILFVPSVQDWVRSKGFEAVTPVKWVLAIISFVAVVGATPA